MDRRQKKTRDAIFKALRTLMEQKQYSAITVQEIIDEANIGRSTFYAHFETKDDLLRSLCSEIFYHVFTDLLPQEEDTLDCKNLELKLGHILYHLKENQVNICGIIATDGDGLFMAYFKQYLTQLFSRYTMLFPPGSTGGFPDPPPGRQLCRDCKMVGFPKNGAFSGVGRRILYGCCEKIS